MKRIPLKDTERYTIERFQQCKLLNSELMDLKANYSKENK
jgi:hypothetical protein